MLKMLIKLIPASTIASLIAEYVTKALQKIDNKERAALVSKAVAECGKAVTVVGKAVEDCTITEAEVNEVTTSVETAVKAIIEAAK